jgi:hypothetical protein
MAVRTNIDEIANLRFWAMSHGYNPEIEYGEPDAPAPCDACPEPCVGESCEDFARTGGPADLAPAPAPAEEA